MKARIILSLLIGTFMCMGVAAQTQEEVKIGYLNEIEILDNWNSFKKLKDDMDKHIERYARGEDAYSEQEWESIVYDLSKLKFYLDKNINLFSVAVRNTALEKGFDVVIDKGTIYYWNNHIRFNKERDISNGLKSLDGKKIVFLNTPNYIQTSKFKEEWNKLGIDWEREANLITKKLKEKCDEIEILYNNTEDTDDRIKLLKEMNELKEESQDILALRHQEMFEPTMNKIKSFVINEIKDTTYSLIIEGSSDSEPSDYSVFYIKEKEILSDKSLDITNMVLKELNK
jgi:Skp family chaperone for outer membrane proteins